MTSVPEMRVRAANAAEVRADGEYVVYWMIAARRTTANFALQRALDRARELGRPLVVLEALRTAYPHASDRLHRFILAGMADTAARLEGGPVLYHPYVEPAAGAGRGLVEALAAHACLVVTDEFPCFFLPRMVAAAAARLPVRLEVVDANGLLPLAATEACFPTAHAFRRFLQRTLPLHLAEPPSPDPLSGAPPPRLAALPAGIAERWPAASAALLAGGPAALAALPIDHVVAPVDDVPGGASAAHRALARFVAGRLDAYAEARNHPDLDATSGLSPYLHFGHLGAWEVFSAVAAHEGWHPDRVADRATGSRTGWWGMRPAAEAFVDQLVTWRELGFNFAAHRPDAESYEALPPWALATLARHAGDPRPHVYSHKQLEDARTHDPLWNACQTQLVREGTIHGYLRMLWGKKIIEW